MVCEGKAISFQIDPTTVLDLDDIVGKSFNVVLGSINYDSRNVRDLNGNELEFNIEFQRSFAFFDLSRTSVSFDFHLEGMDCSDELELGTLTDDIQADIASILGISDVSRIAINTIFCTENGVIANIRILPAVGRRILLESVRPHELFHELLEKSKTSTSPFAGRRLGSSAKFAVSKLKLIPSGDDEMKFQTPIEMQAKEKQSYEEISVLPHHSSSAALSYDSKSFDDSQLDELREAIHRDMREEIDAIHRDSREEIKELEGLFFKAGAFISFFMFAVGGFVVHVLTK